MSARRTLAIAGTVAAAGTLTACGSGGEPSDEQVARIRAEALREFRAEQRQRRAAAKLEELERELRRLKRRNQHRPAAPAAGGGAPAAPPSSGSSCGGGLSVNSVTSCPFAQNVAEAYRGSGGASSIEVYSPVTGTTYTMSCSGGVPATCSGGNGAVVSIR